MVDYRDKENVDEVIGRIKSAPTMKEVFEVIDEIYPSWIVGLSQKYCSDYQSFTDNWKHICRANNVKPHPVFCLRVCFTIRRDVSSFERERDSEFTKYLV